METGDKHRKTDAEGQTLETDPGHKRLQDGGRIEQGRLQTQRNAAND
jgi:hypothetical protein